MALVLWAPAKLTLSLRITGVRDDGFHLIDAEMVTLDLADRLEIDPGGDRVEMEDGSPPPGGDDDLVVRALRIAGRRAGVRLGKQIPPGAGLGGGSADAAAVLRWAGIADLELAASIGADVAFCLVGGRARVHGIGERVDPQPFEERTFTLLVPDLACPTPAVYERWDELGAPIGANGNDLEPAALDVEPRLGAWRDQLGEATGEIPRLAGSGSTWFVEGPFPGEGRMVVTATPAGWSGYGD
jgi:4-diphosphocytidyl-2-C-methyl-D-erythritol kinase